MVVSKEEIIEEKELVARSGGMVLVLSLLVYALGIAGTIYSAIGLENGEGGAYVAMLVISIIILTFGWIPWMGLKIIKPNEALVLTLFGKYIGSLKKNGFYFVNPFCTAVKPSTNPTVLGFSTESDGKTTANLNTMNKKISLKSMTLDNKKQKINDEMGNPIEVGIIVIWKVVNTAKAVFQVDNYETFVSIQADSALRDVVRQYPYDSTDESMSLRASSLEIAEQLKEDLQERVVVAGIEVQEARITHLAYAPEIATAMLQRQQASAVIDARQKIVEGAVGMVEMALNKLNESDICELDDERKAAMVSNLLVVLCGNKDAQPIVNSGSIY